MPGALERLTVNEFKNISAECTRMGLVDHDRRPVRVPLSDDVERLRLVLPATRLRIAHETGAA